MALVGAGHGQDAKPGTVRPLPYGDDMAVLPTSFPSSDSLSPAEACPHSPGLQSQVPHPQGRYRTDSDMASLRGSLSPSRAGDFMTCPLLYRFRVIDRLPEEPSPAAVRGTLVHRVLELLFDQPASQRELGQASELGAASLARGPRVGRAAHRHLR